MSEFEEKQIAALMNKISELEQENKRLKSARWKSIKDELPEDGESVVMLCTDDIAFVPTYRKCREEAWKSDDLLMCWKSVKDMLKEAEADGIYRELNEKEEEY